METKFARHMHLKACSWASRPSVQCSPFVWNGIWSASEKMQVCWSVCQCIYRVETRPIADTKQNDKTASSGDKNFSRPEML